MSWVLDASRRVGFAKLARPGWGARVVCVQLLLLSASAPGCSGEETKAEAVTSASASAAPRAMTLQEYCPQVCQRASDCGLARAKRLAEIGRGDDLKLVEAAEDRQKEHYFKCKRQCEGAPVAPADRAEFERATGCLKIDDCAQFEACIHGEQADGGADAGAGEESRDE